VVTLRAKKIHRAAQHLPELNSTCANISRTPPYFR
jgi:hypothetical protein